MSTPVSPTATPILVEDVKEWLGRDVLGPADEKHGKLEDVFYDGESDAPSFASVKHGTIGKKLTLVPLAGATAGRDFLRVTVDKDRFKSAPSFDTDTELSVDDEASVFGHFGVSYTPAGQGARRLAKR
jgi:hypothetical protein